MTTINGTALVDYLEGTTSGDTLIGDKGDDTLYGGNGADRYVFNMGDGHDTIGNYQDTPAQDRLVLGAGFSAAHTQLNREGYDLVITFSNSPDDSVRVLEFYGGAKAVLPLIQFADGSRWNISPGNLANTVYQNGSPYPDVLEGYDGKDVIQAIGTRNKISGFGGDDLLDGGADWDSLFGGNGQDTLIGGTGNDALSGGEGLDSYVFSKGDGHDVISNYQAIARQDRLVLGEGFTAANIRLNREGKDLVISFSNSSGDSVRVNGHFSYARNQLPLIQFADGSTQDINPESLANLVYEQTGSASGDHLLGYDGQDVLMAGGGNDVLSAAGGKDLLDGGTGADTMMGGAGNDTYVVEQAGDVVLEAVDTIVRVSTNSDNAEVNGSSYAAILSVDGSKVAFQSSASNLVAGDTNQTSDIFIKDLSTGKVSLISKTQDGVQANGMSINPMLSADGKKVLFASLASNLVAGDANENIDIFIKDLTTGELRLVNTASDGTHGNDASVDGVFFPDDNKVLFASLSSNLVAGDANESIDIFIKDLITGELRRVSTTSDGNEANGNSRIVKLSSDGSKMLFISDAENLVPAGSNVPSGPYVEKLFVKDLTTGIVSLIDPLNNGLVESDIEFSPDGSKVMFKSEQKNLIPGYTGSSNDIFIKDLNTGVISLVTATIDGTQTNGMSFVGGFSPDGSKVMFESWATNLVPGDIHRNHDVFIKDLSTGVISRVSMAADGVEANSDTYEPEFSADGSKIIFGSWADNLVAGDFNNNSDIFIKSLDGTAFDSGGIDTVQSRITYTLGAYLENLVLTGTAALNGTGNALSNKLTGNAAANRLDGGTGVDTLIGGAGNDTYIVDTGDTILENFAEGVDLVMAGGNYTLGSDIENLRLTGTAASKGTGNSLGNSLTGNSAANRLDGGTGTDTLTGGLGADTYIIDNVGDKIIESSTLAGEIDHVVSTVSYTLVANLENLSLAGTAAIDATGNKRANILTGNSAANSLSGGAGADTLRGGAGDDTYLMARGGEVDTVVENDSTAGNTDVLSFLSGVAHDQLWFKHVGNNLEVSIIGTADKVVIRDWYTGTNQHIEQIRTVTGNKTLLDSKVENLVTAMSTMTPPPLGQTNLTTAEHAQLDAVIAANWS